MAEWMCLPVLDISSSSAMRSHSSRPVYPLQVGKCERLKDFNKDSPGSPSQLTAFLIK